MVNRWDAASPVVPNYGGDKPAGRLPHIEIVPPDLLKREAQSSLKRLVDAKWRLGAKPRLEYLRHLERIVGVVRGILLRNQDLPLHEQPRRIQCARARTHINS